MILSSQVVSPTTVAGGRRFPGGPYDAKLNCPGCDNLTPAADIDSGTSVAVSTQARAGERAVAPAFRARMERLDEICVEEGRGPEGLRRCYFAGWADEPFFASAEATTDLVGRYAEAGATDFTFYLQNPAAGPLLDDLVASHRMATRDQLERVAVEVFPNFRG